MALMGCGYGYGEPGSTNGNFAICALGAVSRMSTDGVSSLVSAIMATTGLHSPFLPPAFDQPSTLSIK